METKTIYQEMRKTKHAINRQYDRGINDFLLERIGWKIPFFQKGKNIYVVKLSTLRQCGYDGLRKFLVLVMKHNVLITIYFEDNFQAIHSKKENNTKYHLI